MHTAGLEGMLFIDDQPKVKKDSSIETSAMDIAKRPLITEPGKNYSYSNAGSFILALFMKLALSKAINTFPSNERFTVLICSII